MVSVSANEVCVEFGTAYNARQPRMRQAMEKLEEEEEYLADVEADEAGGEEEGSGSGAEAEEGEETEASLEEILSKKGEERVADEEEDEESILSLGREERIETLSVKVVPPDPNKEFTCRKCYLVKHRSQLADKKRMYCRDCV